MTEAKPWWLFAAIGLRWKRPDRNQKRQLRRPADVASQRITAELLTIEGAYRLGIKAENSARRMKMVKERAEAERSRPSGFALITPSNGSLLRRIVI